MVASLFSLNVSSINSFLILLLTINLFACGKTKVKTEVKKVPKNTYITVPKFIRIQDSLMAPQPIESQDSAVQSYGQAVAKIIGVEGNVGSGFFISPDGLFLTSSLNINHSLCTGTNCQGYKIVLNNTPEGKHQVFKQIKLLAMDSNLLQFALFKVTLPDDKKVSFLQLEMNPLVQEFKLASLGHLGHPLGATLHYTVADFAKLEKNKIDLYSLSFNQDRGAPIIFEKTGKVIGLVQRNIHETNQDKGKAGISYITSGGLLKPIIDKLKQDLILINRGNSLSWSGQVRDGSMMAPKQVDYSEQDLSLFAGMAYKNYSKEQFKSLFSYLEIIFRANLEGEFLEKIFSHPGENRPFNQGFVNEFINFKYFKLQREINLPSVVKNDFEQKINSLPFFSQVNYYFFSPVEKEGRQQKCLDDLKKNNNLNFSSSLWSCSSLKEQGSGSLIAQAIKKELDKEFLEQGFQNVIANFSWVRPLDHKEKDLLLKYYHQEVLSSMDLKAQYQFNAAIFDAIFGLRVKGSFY